MNSFSKQLLIGISLVLINIITLQGQDSLSSKNLTPLSYTFSVENGEMTGPGANFLLSEAAKSQYTMLGEYHGSKQISRFTEALIPNLDQVGYHTMALEVGPISGEYLNQLPNNKTALTHTLNEFHKNYHMVEDGEVVTTIPFFDYKEDAQFLGEAKSKKWDIIGIDQEYYYSFVMLSDWMFNNLTKKQQGLNKELFYKATDTLNYFYKTSESSNIKLFTTIQNSRVLNEFFQTMNEFEINKKTVDAIQESIEIYALNERRKWYTSSATRITHMKNNLRQGFESIKFDLTEDKMLIKMGGYHLSKGFSPLALFEVGNTLNELAEYHGNTAINIGFLNRFEQDGDQLVDAMDSENGWTKSRQAFLSLGDKKHWTVIDLRPMRGGTYFHPVKYMLNKVEEEMIQRYDILIITPTDSEGIPNY